MVPLRRLKVTECGYLEAVDFELFHFVYFFFTCFCLKELLQLEWELFTFYMPQDFYFLASNSVCKGWFMK